MTWTSLGRIASVPVDHFARFGAMSPDELTVAWTSTTGDIYVADRSTWNGEFGPPVKVNGTEAALAPDKVALSPTGTTLIAVRADRGGLVGFQRSGRTEPWTVTTGLEFTQIRAAFEGDVQVSEPVLSADKRNLFFLLTPAGQPPALHETVWDSLQRSWGFASNIAYGELESTDATHRRRPTGTSSDGRTLFFFDEMMNVQRAAWRDEPTTPFRLFLTLGAFPEAVASVRCDTLYYQGQDALGSGVFLGE